MERERDIVSRRIERMERKVDATGTPQGQLEAMLAVAKSLRMEKERERELQQQRQAQTAAAAHAQQRVARLEQHLNDLRQASAGATPESLMQKLEEETRVNAYIVTQVSRHFCEMVNSLISRLLSPRIEITQGVGLEAQSSGKPSEGDGPARAWAGRHQSHQGQDFCGQC
jgi:hypothetical protein